MLSLQACPSHSVQCSRLAVVSLLPTLLRGSPELSGTKSNSLWGLPGPANMDGLAHPSVSLQGHADFTTSQTTSRRPSPQPSWPLDSSQTPCLSFPASLSLLPEDQEGSPALPGQAKPRALHVAGQAPRPASENADLHSRPRAWGQGGVATFLCAGGSQNWGSSCPGQGRVWPGEGAEHWAALW